MTATLRLIFGEGFRIFFLAAALFAIFAVLIWTGWLGVHAAGGMVTETPFDVAPHLWHAHEMIFGYATAVLGGFFLTAAPNWTGGPAARAAFIAAVAGLWLAGRIAVWWSGALPPALVAVVDLAFLPALSAKLAVMLLRKPQARNLMFLGLLTLVWSGNLLTHLEWTGVVRDGVAPGLRVGLFGVAAMIAVIGGRIAPAFTRNAMRREGEEARLPVSRPPLEAAGIGAALALPVLLLLGAPDILTGAAALVAGVAQAGRLMGWRTGWTLSRPILWSLHLGFAMLAAGYLAWGAATLGYGSEVAALHIVGIGAVGGMTVAVMSRAILGHAGRELVAPKPVALAYGLMAAAALLRAAGSEVGPAIYNAAMLASGALWILAFALFLVALLPVIAAPRPGKDADRSAA